MWKTSDEFETVKLYNFMRAGSGSAYYKLAKTDTSNILKIVSCTSSQDQTYNGIWAGYVNTNTLKIYDNSMNEIGTMTEIQDGSNIDTTNTTSRYDMTNVVQRNTSVRMRLLDVKNDAILYAVSDNVAMTDFIYKRYENGVITDLGHSGKPFYMSSSYLSGACFGKDTDTAIYSIATDDVNADGSHELHKVSINNNVVTTDELIKSSSLIIGRPLCYDGDSVMAFMGKYFDVSSLDQTGYFTN